MSDEAALAPVNRVGVAFRRVTLEAPRTAPNNTSETLRISREPFEAPVSPTMGPDRSSPPSLRNSTYSTELRGAEGNGGSSLVRAVAHGANGLSGQHELAGGYVDPIHTGKNNIVSSAGIQDQQLAERPIGAGERDPSVGRRADGGAGTRGEERALLRAAETVVFAEAPERRARRRRVPTAFPWWRRRPRQARDAPDRSVRRLAPPGDLPASSSRASRRRPWPPPRPARPHRSRAPSARSAL